MSNPELAFAIIMAAFSMFFISEYFFFGGSD